MKPYQIHTDNMSFVRWLDFVNSMPSSIPEEFIQDWLNTNIGKNHWQFIFLPNLGVSKNEILETFAQAKPGVTWCFDKEEDLCLFSLRWLTNNQNIMWHPV